MITTQWASSWASSWAGPSFSLVVGAMRSETTLQIFTKKEGALITFQGSTMVLLRSDQEGKKKQQGQVLFKGIFWKMMEDEDMGTDHRDLMTVVWHAGYERLVSHSLRSLR